jgi:hypothetical protein
MTKEQAYWYLRLKGVKEPTQRQIAKLILLSKI